MSDVMITDRWLDNAERQMASGELAGMFVDRNDVVALIRECRQLRTERVRLRQIEIAARAFAAVHNPECPVPAWKPESRTLRICLCGFESLRGALEIEQ